jgi:hypothetical protein
MLSARAYSFRQKSRLAISLSWIAGYTNTATLLLLGTTTSHVTGNVTHFGEHLVKLDWPQVGFFGFMMLCFLAVLFLLWIIFVDWWRPIADVHELDLFSDPELKMFGIVKALLPAELALYRLSHHRADADHRPPNFEHWIDRLPARARVIVLALSPFTRLDSNAILDLHQAIQRLRREHRRLVVAGVKPAQYKLLDAHGVADLLAVEDFCPDLEFAIARGIELVRELRGERSLQPSAAAP